MKGEDILMRIREYISHGGLFNPDLMDHDKVRDLVVDCRGAIQAAVAQRETLESALRSIANSSCCGCCQEAALMARHALSEATEEAR
jgi:bacterioferritin-associated ferredoxin